MAYLLGRWKVNWGPGIETCRNLELDNFLKRNYLLFKWAINLSDTKQKNSKKRKLGKDNCQLHYKRNHSLFDTLSTRFGKTPSTRRGFVVTLRNKCPVCLPLAHIITATHHLHASLLRMPREKKMSGWHHQWIWAVQDYGKMCPNFWLGLSYSSKSLTFFFSWHSQWRGVPLNI